MGLLIVCLLFWLIVIGVPIWISIWLGQANHRSHFKQQVKSLRGLIIRESSDSIEVRLPSSLGLVPAAFFPRSAHWYGTRVLELHFPLPATGAQLFICGNPKLSRELPQGWSRWSDPTLARDSRMVTATASPQTAATYFEGGLVQAYRQLEKIHPQTSRLAINNDQLLVLVSDFSNSSRELSSLLVFGTQLAQQLESLQTGQIQLATAVCAAKDAQCPVCFSPVVRPVVCDRCGTPHCHDCWSYNEYRCGVFGCGGAPISR